MAFLEERISTAVRRGSRGGPTAQRSMLRNALGELHQQHFVRDYPLHRYSFDFGNKTIDNAAEVRDYFYVVLFTPYEGFRARDWNDYLLTQANSRLTLVSGSIYQIRRVYRAGAAEFLRTIRKPVDGTVTVYRTRSGVVTVATATVDETTGQATITGHAGGDTYTCEGEFDVPVAFTNDDDLAQIALDGNPELIIQGFGEIQLEELPP